MTAGKRTAFLIQAVIDVLEAIVEKLFVTTEESQGYHY